MNQLRVRLLGGLEVDGVDPQRLGSRKARTLLRVLALARGRPVATDRLMDVLWGDDPPARPADQLAVLVSRLRSVLGRDRIARTESGYILHADRLDADELAALATEAASRLRAGSIAPARAAASAAIALARGPLLADEPDAWWADADRAACARALADALRTAAEACLRTGDTSEAISLAERVLADDPFDEPAVRIVISAHAAAGRQAAAIATYEALLGRLADELGTDPAPETRELHARIVSGETRGVPPAAPVLAGRSRELAILDDELALARASVRVVCVEGEAGMGKTALIEAWASRAGVRILRGTCRSVERDLPLHAIAQALETIEPELGDEAAMLGPLLGRAGGDTSSDPAAGRAGLFGAVLSALARAAPAALLLDDVHLSGPSTMAWLDYAAGRPIPILVVCARRAGEGTDVPAARTISLGPLELDAAAEIVGAERAAELHVRSGGIPLYLVELARSGEEIPETLLAAITARCDALGGEAATTVRTAAVIGPDVDLELLAAVLGAPAATLLDHLEAAARAGLLDDRPGFAHELVREAIVGGTTTTRRAFVHREAARALAVREDAEPLAVAEHARLGGDGKLAADALVHGARLAAARFDHDAALDMLDRSITLHDTVDGRLARARVRIWRTDFAGARVDAVAAMAIGGGAPAVEAAGWSAYYERDLDTAMRLAEDGARLSDDDQVRASCLVLGGHVLHAWGELRSAATKLDRAAAVARGPQLVQARLWRGVLGVHHDDPAVALDLVHAATLPGASPYPFASVYALTASAHALGMLGRVHEALDHLDAADREIERIGSSRFAGRTDNYRGWIWRNIGETGRADEANERALAVSDDPSCAEAHTFALLDLADGRIRAGELDRARELLAWCEPWLRVRQVRGWREALRLRMLEARIALTVGAHEEAAALFPSIAEDAAATGVGRYEAQAVIGEAIARAAAGAAPDPQAAWEALQRLERTGMLEARWLARDLAVVDDAFAREADRIAATIAANAGPLRESIEALSGLR